jgi:hypothetical protein
VSVGVRRTSVGLSAAVRSFLVEFDCWFGESPTDSPAGKSVGLTSPTSMHRKVTGKSPDNSSHSRAKKLSFWIGRVRRSPTGVRPEKGGECKDLPTTSMPPDSRQILAVCTSPMLGPTHRRWAVYTGVGLCTPALARNGGGGPYMLVLGRTRWH